MLKQTACAPFDEEWKVLNAALTHWNEILLPGEYDVDNDDDSFALPPPKI